MNGVLSPVQREDLKELLKFIYLDLEEFKPGEFKFRQHSSLDSKFSHPSAVSYVSQYAVGLYKLPGVAMSSVSNLVDVLLKADELWWCATRIVDSKRGTLSVDNPFKNCKSIDEAKVKADLLTSKQALYFMSSNKLEEEVK